MSGSNTGVKQRYGDYLIGETFAKGSFGKLKHGTHVPTNTKLAIKVLSRQKITTSKMDHKIRREIRILKLFRHPSICRLYDVIYTPTEILLVMEFVGPELYEYIVKNGRLKEDAARYVFQQIVCALEYCHHYRVVHRDLKPENVLLGSQLSVKLIDFGLSNLMQDTTFLKTSCGSPNYAAPEVISGRLYAGPEIDVWSCGVVLYALLCGCLPFDEETIPLLFARIKKGKYSIPSHVSSSARDLVEKLLVVDPLARITIPQVRDHPWFLEKLPPHLQYNDRTFSRDPQDFGHGIVSKAMQLLDMTQQEMHYDLQRCSGRGWVTCNILADAKQASEIQSVGISVTQRAEADVRSPQQQPLRASDRETNQGLVLSASPAMLVMLDCNDAITNKAPYNSGTYLPASVQESKSTTRLLANSPGTFSFSNQQSGLTASNTSSSLPITGSLRQMTPANAGGMNHDSGPKPRSGSVAQTTHIYSVEEENFILQNNIGWRLGIMTASRSMQVMTEIYGILAALNMEWKVLNPFQIAIRQRGATADGEGPVVVALHLMRIQEKHDKGYVIDMSLCRGSACVAMDMINVISERIKSRLG